MNIFITGATGYIGNALAKTLASEGHIVHTLCRDAGKKKLLEHSNIKIFDGDILDASAVERAMQGCVQAYHLAAYARVWAKNPATYYTVNVEGTKVILDSARKLRVEKIVFTSTAGVLGPSGAQPVKEDDARIGDVMNEYEDSKKKAEALCKDYCQRYNMHIVIVNPPRIYGPGIETESNAVTKLAKLYMRGKWRIMPGDGTKTGSYVYIDDVVNGHILAMQKGRSKERYILSGVNAAYNEFFTILSDVTGKQLRLINLPVWAMMLAGRFMMLRTKLTGKPPLLTPKWIKKYLYDWSLSCEKAQTELGYTYMPLREGLEKTICWLKKQEM
ncbi:MAG TPA: NAD-dependent epimerase/dehydratase family protein [Chitinophagaceae bacterium]|nr:NAD-dependent epimerase/dehydratase family protein [Chitinophagaceae bacterium]